MTCASSSRPADELNPLRCCWPVTFGPAQSTCFAISLAGVFDITWNGLQWRIPLCQHHADMHEAGAPSLELEDMPRLRAIGRCWDDERALGLLVCWCPSHGIHRETLAKLAALARPQIFPQQEEDET